MQLRSGTEIDHCYTYRRDTYEFDEDGLQSCSDAFSVQVANGSEGRQRDGGLADGKSSGSFGEW